MRKELEDQVWERAVDRCEYCGAAQTWLLTPFQIDHVIAQKHDGPTIEGNLALACFNCNIHKGSDIASLDSGVLTRLLNPRDDRWIDHFALDAASRLTPTV
jgi:5-methylcytosine-specific restriction endonuclease McrA